MMRIHVNLAVEDLDGSVEFYTRLFGASPTVRKHDYAQWRLDDPAVNFAVGSRSGRSGIEHLGIEAGGREELEVLRERVAQVPSTTHEGETVCCYARSDKSWVTDDAGISWELFYTHGTSETFAGETRRVEKTCCRETPTA